MPAAAPPIASLALRNFRGLAKLDIDKMSRFTLLAGDNGVGKTSVLQALRLFAARGAPHVLLNLLNELEENIPAVNRQEEQILLADPAALYHGRQPEENDWIAIAANNPPEELKIRYGPAAADPRGMLDDEAILTTKFQEQKQTLSLEDLVKHAERSLSKTRPPGLPCAYLSDETANIKSLAQQWDQIALTPEEEVPKNALRLIYGNQVQGISMQIHAAAPGTAATRRPIVKLAEQKKPLPLVSLGQGAVHLFALGLTLAAAPANSLLLIDEVDKSMHRLRRKELWDLILQTADRKNLQVVATTHSWDCVLGFTHSLTELENPNGCLLRLSQKTGWTKAVHYSLEDLQICAQQGIEMR